MLGAVPPLLPSWRGAQFKKSTGTTLDVSLDGIRVVGPSASFMSHTKNCRHREQEIV